jgi:hypothetical protein
VVVAGLAALTTAQVSRERALAQAARDEAEPARRKAEDQERRARQRAEQAGREVERLLYAANIQAAQRALTGKGGEGKKP